MQRQWFAETEVQGSKDAALHAPDVSLAVGIVCDVDKVCHFRGVHLLVLGGDQHGRHSHQLQLVLGYLLYLIQKVL